LTTEPIAFNLNLDPETLEVNDDGENDDSSNKIHDIGQAVAPKCLVKSTSLVIPSE
jgi:hypothetical protein